MTREPTPKQTAGGQPDSDPQAPAQRSGAGADTAFAAMLKKRRSASNGETLPEVDPPTDGTGKPAQN